MKEAIKYKYKKSQYFPDANFDLIPGCLKDYISD